MKSKRLSRKLSPQAKKAVMFAVEGERLQCLVHISPAQIEEVTEQIHSLGGVVRSWIEEAHLATVEIDALRLEELAEGEGITFIETRSHYAL